MGLFKTFIVPFDFSANSEVALRAAAGWAARSGADLVVVHGMRTPIIGSKDPVYSYKELVAGLQQHLEVRIQTAVRKAGGAAARVVVRPQEIQLWIGPFAKDNLDPLILLSRRGWSGKTKGQGATARAIVQHAPVPAWLVANEKAETKSVVAAIDLDERNEVVARTAKQAAREMGAGLRLLHVRDPLRETGYLNEVGWPVAAAVFDDLSEVAARKVSALAAQLGEPGFSVEARLATGSIATTVIREARAAKAGLIVVGKHTKKFLETLFLGSTTDGIAAKWEGHLLIVP